MTALPILVVEDDADLREAIVTTLSLASYHTVEASDGAQALEQLKKHPIGLVISDAQMAPIDGYALFDTIKISYPGLPFILMTAYGDIERAITLLRAGAAHYLLKPFDAQTLIHEAQKHLLCMAHDSADDAVVVESAAMRQLFSLASRVAQSEATVLIVGPSGCGKEVLARYIHRHSPRNKGPFIAVNCAAIPASLLESTLFGHEKGAFTGANQTLIGKFEQAQGGTLLLDEVTEMPRELQAKFLRVLQERELERVGGVRTVPLDIRVLATTNRPIQSLVAQGQFREDLYFRLNVFPLHILPLASRREDILPLAKLMLKKYRNQSVRNDLVLSIEAQKKLVEHAWEGNVRELENTILRAVILASEPSILPSDLLLSPQSSPDKAMRPDKLLPEDMQSVEKRHILETLAAVGGVKKRAAEQLGISERTLRYKLQRYGSAQEDRTQEAVI